MSRVLGPGDVIILMSGGHGFEVLEDLNMVEVKQGPYVGDADKTRFEAALPLLSSISNSGTYRMRSLTIRRQLLIRRTFVP